MTHATNKRRMSKKASAALDWIAGAALIALLFGLILAAGVALDQPEMTKSQWEAGR